MFITHVKVKNWRNFREAEFDLTQPVSYIIGPNASGKSNLIDVFRFLRDIAKPTGGGLQQAVRVRGGMAAVRCGYARQDPEVRVEVTLADSLCEPRETWCYRLGFKAIGGGAPHRVLITREEVWRGDEGLVSRPDSEDEADPLLLTETHLEQTRANARFRDLAETLAAVSYLHVVPQLLRHGDAIGGNRLEGDPFGQGLMERVGFLPDEERRHILGKIFDVLSFLVPEFSAFRYGDINGSGRRRFFAEIKGPGREFLVREDQFSDGTIRLFGILWSLMDGHGLLLLEEPELSLHTAVVEQLPALISRAQRDAKHRRQVIISTHSEVMLSNPGIDAGAVVRLMPGKEGSEVAPITATETAALKAGFSVAEAVLPKTRPKGIENLSLWK